MSAKNDLNTANTADRELVNSRLLDAPRELVFRAFTDPRHVVHWWGLNGFTNTNHEMRVQPGGVWRFTMHGPDGVDFPNQIVYHEVVKPERLVYTHSDGSDHADQCFHVTVTFAAQGNKTLLTMRMVFASAAICEQHKQFGAVEGGRQTLARLAAYLPSMVE